MKFRSRATGDFWRTYDALPAPVKARATQSFRQFQADPSHRGLNFKRVNDKEPVYVARVGRTHRALCRMDGDIVTWFWIGHHDEYIRLLGS